jgi:hypothetical protein
MDVLRKKRKLLGQATPHLPVTASRSVCSATRKSSEPGSFGAIADAREKFQAFPADDYYFEGASVGLRELGRNQNVPNDRFWPYADVAR